MELNADQRRAVEAVRGPVCILAGAGSGKTTTITHRIANQVASGAFLPSQILAVTFTEKAAGEMRARLERLGVSGVRASTFHSAALAQLRYFRPDGVGRILASKALMVRQIANSLPAPYKFRAAGDLATEIEWAHNRRIPPERYLASLDEHTPPIPPDLMLRVYRRYEERKQAEGLMDFEDLLERAIQTFDDEHAVAELRERYVAFTVDEYQDVNLLQQTLLDRWLGPRDDLCVVGDDYQSIYGFTGATPEHLLRVPERFPHAEVIRLEDNYRSTPQVLELANRLVPKLGGAEKVLRATRPDGPEPEVRPFPTAEAEGAFLVERIRAAGCPLEEVAILCRTHARLAELEPVLHEARIPYQGSALLAREAARRVLRALDPSAPAAESVRTTALEHGWLPTPEPGARRARARAAGRSVPAGQARGGDRRVGRGFPGGARAPLRRRDGFPPRRPPDHLPRRQGPRVRGRTAAAPRGEGVAAQAGAHAGRRRGGAAPLLRRPDAGEARAGGHLGEEAEPLPRRADGRPAACRGAARGVRGAEGLAARPCAGRTRCPRT